MVVCGAQKKANKKEFCKINVKPGERCRFHPNHIPGSGLRKDIPKSKTPKHTTKSLLQVIDFADVPWLVNITTDPFELPLETVEFLQKYMTVLCYWNDSEAFGRKVFLRGDFNVLKEAGIITPNTYCFSSKGMSRNFLVEKLGESGIEIAFASDGCCSKLVSVLDRNYVVCNLEGKVFERTVTLENFGLIDDPRDQESFAKIISRFPEFKVSKEKALQFFEQAKSDLKDKKFKGDYLHFGIRAKGVPAGYLYVRPLQLREFEKNALHIRIAVSRKYQGKGIATQALSQFREISQKIKNPIYSLVDITNIASNALMKKMGYRLKTTIKVFGKDHNVYIVV